MRHIHDGTLRETTIDPPPVFVVDEQQTPARGRTDTAALAASMLPTLRRVEKPPLFIGHGESDDEWSWSE